MNPIRMKPKPRQSVGGYVNAELDVTTTGIGKNYNGYRIFHDRETGFVERIGKDYVITEPNLGELIQCELP